MRHRLPVIFFLFSVLMTGCVSLLSDPVRLVFDVEYPGEWNGIIAKDDYYPEGDLPMSQPGDTATTEAIGGPGDKEYVVVPDKNWYYISASKTDGSTNVMVIRISTMNAVTEEKTALITVSNSVTNGSITTNIYTPDYGL